MNIDLGHPDVKGQLLRQIMEKMTAPVLTRSIRLCKKFWRIVDENKTQFSCPFPSRHLCLEIEPAPGLAGDRAETSVVALTVDCVTWNKEIETHERNKTELYSKVPLVPFLEKDLSNFSIFRYGTILFHFKEESVMLRVLAALRKSNFRCEEMFYAVCPSLPLAIGALRPRRVGCNSQTNIAMIQSSFKRALPVTLERLSLHAFRFELPALIDGIVEKTVKVELMTASYSPACYWFVMKIMKKLVEEEHTTVELWATLMGAPLPARHFLSQLGEHIYVMSNQEVIVAVVKKNRVVTLQVIQSPCQKSVNLIVRRHRDMAEFLSFYSFVCHGLNRHVLDKLVKRLTKHFYSLKM